VEAQAPARSRGSLYLIWTTALLLAPLEDATLAQVHPRRSEINVRYKAQRRENFHRGRRISYSARRFLGDALDWWISSVLRKRSMLVACHSREKLAFCAEACGKEDELNLTNLSFREAATDCCFGAPLSPMRPCIQPLNSALSFA
jgi:hypothetical protein